MGNDGGSIPKRRELVKEAARNPTTTQIKETHQEQQEYHWTTCPLSHKLLSQPIVSDSSGKIYNKDAILEFLLPVGGGTPGMNKSDNEEVLEGRVRGLRDVVEVKLAPDAQQTEVKGRKQGERWVCPITNKALGPGVKAVYLVPCGHAFSESAVKEVSSDRCLQCNEPYTSENVIPILPASTDEIEHLVARANRLKDQGLTHSLKKAPGSSKKRKKNGEAVVAVDAVPTLTAMQAQPSNAIGKSSNPQPGSGTDKPSGGIKNAATASLTAKVLEEEKEKTKRRKIAGNENLQSLFSKGKEEKMIGDFMSRGFSIPAGARR
ncbi:MAG: hypothetical protein M1835_002500 [Candelina submexicana]|nr:MAG: hypothetical protein M1835_002500 [Candelina submexicana]